ncbi:MAG: CoA-transferase subunit beta [Promethearchaeota archaeon]
MSEKYSLDELLIIVSAREIKNFENVMLGVGLPMMAGAFAKNYHAKNVNLMMEAGLIGFNPLIPLRHIADTMACRGLDFSTDLFSMFSTHTYRGYVDLCFLGVAQVDKYGNLNSTVVGDYFNFDRRLPGSGGAADFISYSRKTILTMNKGKFVEKLDYLTSPGHLRGGDSREKSKRFFPGSGPVKLISRKGVFKFDDVTKEMYLFQTHPGITIEDIKKDVPWDLKIADNVTSTKPPTAEELELIRKFSPSVSLGKILSGKLMIQNLLGDLPEKGVKYLMEIFSSNQNA